MTGTARTGPRVLQAELAVAAQNELAEGPVWDTSRQQLLWVDIPPGRVHWFDPATGARSEFTAGATVGTAGLTASGGLVLALADGFAFSAADGSDLTRLDVPHVDAAAVWFNEGKPDPWGGFCAGTMDLHEGSRAASLYRLSPDRQITELLSGAGISNGLDWTDDRRLFYYVDSPNGGIEVFDTDPADGSLTGRRRFVEIPAAEGMADGLTLDASGCIWVAIWDGGEVRRYTPDGRLDTVVRLPVSQVTSAAFGGGDLGVLFITTAREDFTAEQRQAQPHAGDIFCCVPGVGGRPAFRFADGGHRTAQGGA
jgi:sugar lactone lactonase YvrE